MNHDLGHLHTDEQKQDLPAGAEGKTWCRLHGITRAHPRDAINGVAAIEEARPGQAVGTSVGCTRRHRRGLEPAVPNSRWTPKMEGMLAPERWCTFASPRTPASWSIDKTGRAGPWPRACIACITPGRTSRGKRYSTAIPHTDPPRGTPTTTYILDNVVRFAGQRVVAVLADTVRWPPKRAAARVVVEYGRAARRSSIPEEAMADGAPPAAPPTTNTFRPR